MLNAPPRLSLLPVSLQVMFVFPDSSALSSCHNRVYQSLANLIRWADQVMLDGIDLEDKENVASVTSVIKAVLDGVKVGHSQGPHDLGLKKTASLSEVWLIG